MKNTLKFEELAMFVLAIIYYISLDHPWWLFLVLILLPDIGMLGYLVNTHVGAITYNLFHHKGIALLVLIIGWQLRNDTLILSGVILFAHSSMDRIFGYGLKYPDSFKRTHLGDL